MGGHTPVTTRMLMSKDRTVCPMREAEGEANHRLEAGSGRGSGE